MKIKQLLEDIKCEKYAVKEGVNITSLCIKDKNCSPGCAFFCLKGNNYNGEDFAKQAVNNGATLIVAERYLDGVNAMQIVVKNARSAFAKMSANFFGNPQKQLKTVGVVGTNGKSTVCTAIASILNAEGVTCGSIGTFGATYDKINIDTGFTTPDSFELFKIMSEMLKCGIKIVCMELSAHAIYYKKVPIKFDVLIFTNCTHDHLDFFGNFEKYREVKRSAFSSRSARVAVINGDDPLGKEICACRDSGVITYGISDPSDNFAIDISPTPSGCNYVINLFDAVYRINSKLYGEFNVYNMLAVATTCALCGIKTDRIASRLNELERISGRMEKISDKPNVFIDYAHTPDGLKRALLELAKIKPKTSKLICVFGCGGNRDTSKRAIMGEISGKYADFTIITSDNPRFEDGNLIIDEIESGVRRYSLDYITVADREKAIEYAVNVANANDYLLIAGKGSENYQEIMGVFKRFCDKQIAKKYILSKYDRL